MIICLSIDASFITALMRLLLDAPSSAESQRNFSAFAGCIVADVTIPNLVWKGGRYTHVYYAIDVRLMLESICALFVCLFCSRTAAALRTACMTCLQIMLQESMLSMETLNGVHSNLLPQVLNTDAIYV